jgi:hypothetical protein
MKREGYSMYSKRLLISFFMFLFVAGLAVLPMHVSAASASMSLTPSTQSVTQGATVSVAVHENSSTDDINGAQVSLTYPTDKLSYTSVTYAGSGFDVQPGATGGSGVVKFSVGKTPPAIQGDQVVATVNFKSIGVGTANIAFGCNLSSGTCSDGNAITLASDSSDILTGTTGAAVTINSSNQLASDQIINGGKFIISSNVLYILYMQTDGNLVLYGNGMRPVWWSGTGGSGATRAVMQADGNLVLYRANNTPAWWTGTNGHNNSTLSVQDDGNMVIYSSGNAPLWQSGTGGHASPTYFGANTLTSGQTLPANQYLRASDGRSALLLQTDGNLLVYGGGYKVLWASGGTGANRAVMQTDGNLVLYRANNSPAWWTNTGGHNSSTAVLQNDGNFVIYSSGNAPLWQSGTGGKL